MRPITVKVAKCPNCGYWLKERSLEKNSHLHLVLGAISKQRKLAGDFRPIETWKRMMVAAFERYKGNGFEMYPALDGQGMDIVYRRTSELAEEEIRELIHFAEAWAIDNDVVLPEREQEVV